MQSTARYSPDGLDLARSYYDRGAHKTFEAYCRDVWGMSKPYATQVIGAASITEAIKGCNCNQFPTTESQARPLTKLKDPEQQRDHHEDKRRAVKMALELRSDLSDRAIAEHCGVNHTFVGKIRKQLVSNTSSDQEPPKTRKGRDGKERKLPRKKAPRRPCKPRGRRNLTTYECTRIHLMLDDILRPVAKENQRQSAGRGQKGLTKSTNLKPTNTRKEIAKAAGVPENTVHKVRTIEAKADKETKAALRREDKRHAVVLALEADPEATDRLIAEHCRVSDMTVGRVRKELQQSGSSSYQDPPTRVGRDGKRRKAPKKKARGGSLSGGAPNPPRWSAGPSIAREKRQIRTFSTTWRISPGGRGGNSRGEGLTGRDK